MMFLLGAIYEPPLPMAVVLLNKLDIELKNLSIACTNRTLYQAHRTSK
jgi:hypothetical protein